MNCRRCVESTDGRAQQGFVGAQFRGPRIHCQAGRCWYLLQEDPTLGKYVNGFFAEEARQGSDLLHSFVDADGDASGISEV
jgi:hypothetical protein